MIDDSGKPLGADSQVFRSTTIGCIKCLEVNVSTLKDDMGQLKKAYGDVQPSRTFSCIPFVG